MIERDKLKEMAKQTGFLDARGDPVVFGWNSKLYESLERFVALLLSSQAEQEPVAWLTANGFTPGKAWKANPAYPLAVYLAPQPAPGFNEAIELALDAVSNIEASDDASAAAIERAHDAIYALARPSQTQAPVQSEEATNCVFDDWPEYRAEAMGCGLEDRGITDRYEAMRYGWDQCIESLGERIEQFCANLPRFEFEASQAQAPSKPATDDVDDDYRWPAKESSCPGCLRSDCNGECGGCGLMGD